MLFVHPGMQYRSLRTTVPCKKIYWILPNLLCIPLIVKQNHCNFERFSVQWYVTCCRNACNMPALKFHNLKLCFVCTSSLVQDTDCTNVQIQIYKYTDSKVQIHKNTFIRSSGLVRSFVWGSSDLQIAQMCKYKYTNTQIQIQTQIHKVQIHKKQCFAAQFLPYVRQERPPDCPAALTHCRYHPQETEYNFEDYPLS